MYFFLLFFQYLSDVFFLSKINNIIVLKILHHVAYENKKTGLTELLACHRCIVHTTRYKIRFIQLLYLLRSHNLFC